MEGPLRRREEASDHVHVDAGDEPAGHLRVADEVRLRARDLRQPQEADRTAGIRNRSVADRGLERPRDFQDRRAAGGVVVGSRRLVAEVRRQDDFAEGGSEPGIVATTTS